MKKTKPVVTINSRNAGRARKAMRRTVAEGFGVNMEQFNKEADALFGQADQPRSDSEVWKSLTKGESK